MKMIQVKLFFYCTSMPDWTSGIGLLLQTINMAGMCEESAPNHRAGRLYAWGLVTNKGTECSHVVFDPCPPWPIMQYVICYTGKYFNAL